MTKENMQKVLEGIEAEVHHLTEQSTALRAYITSQEFKELSDFESALTITQHHQLESYARILIMRASLIGARLADPEGDRPTGNDETPSKVIVPPTAEVVPAGNSVKVGDTIITGG